MADADGRLSADGVLDPAPGPSKQPEPERSYTPRSPRPRLFDYETPGTGPQASDVLTEKDYARLRVIPFGRMMIPALLGASAIGKSFRLKPGLIHAAFVAPIAVRRIRPPGPQHPGKLRTSAFIVSLAALMSINTYSLLTTSVRDARAKAYHDSLPRTDDGQIILPDRSATQALDRAPLLASAPAVQTEEPASPEETKKREIIAELARLGKAKERTRWSKGKGLDGEVEEEPEMRDTFFRPGTPRKDA